MSNFNLLNRSVHPSPYYPERILQFGEGNFLRAFTDWMVNRMNIVLDYNTGIVIIQPREHNKIARLNAQDGLYTVRLTGLEQNELSVEHEIITCVNRGINPYSGYSDFMSIAENPDLKIVISNTTEAGVTFDPNDSFNDEPPSSFPGKLTKFLYARYLHFSGSPDSGLIHLPCELLERNGDALLLTVREYAALWDLPDGFLKWLHEHCLFCNSLVDRIVPGYPRERAGEIFAQLGYEDRLLVEAERFHLWVIEASQEVARAFPAPDAGLNVVFTEDLESYRLRKVRILNGAHTAMVPVGYLAGLETVQQCIDHEVIGDFIRDYIYEEVIPTLDLPQDEINQYAEDIIERFRNPSIKHFLLTISLNSISKYKTRLLPTVVEYHKLNGELPSRAVFALAALLRFYRGDHKGRDIQLNDEQGVITSLGRAWTKYGDGLCSLENMVTEVLQENTFWDYDLSKIPGLASLTSGYLELLLDDDPSKNIIEILSRQEIHKS